jgi:formate dehydrogenase major subunit
MLSTMKGTPLAYTRYVFLRAAGKPGARMQITRRDFLRLIAGGGSGTALSGLIAAGVNLAPTVARAQALRIREAKTTPSVCPYCSVGCATLVHTIEGRIVNVEGDPRSPHNEGTLCPKGAAIFQLHVNPNRPTQVLHRAPGAAEWEVWDLGRAMDRVAELVKKTRDETFVERLDNGKLVNCTTSIFALGGATLEIEFNHVHQKLMRGLGIVAIENQARI